MPLCLRSVSRHLLPRSLTSEAKLLLIESHRVDCVVRGVDVLLLIWSEAHGCGEVRGLPRRPVAELDGRRELYVCVIAAVKSHTRACYIVVSTIIDSGTVSNYALVDT